MGGGGKGGTTTQTVSIPPEVLARYNAVNARAENVAARPFQQYGTTPEAFVAPLTATQQAGIAGTNVAAGMAQPFYGAASGLTMGGAQAVGPLTQQQIGYYQNPFTQSVVDPTVRALQQEFGQQRAQQQGQAIRAGAFGGDRAGLERANLMRQQGLGMAQAIAPLYSQGYQTGVQTAIGQQGVIASDLQRQLAAGQQLAGLGTGAQAAALQGAQAQLGAGQIQQQTEQAGKAALYNQFLQEQGYPFQVAQFLANIAMGTGALSGSTTQTTQPGGFFSDRRLKEDVKKVGETFDGQPIYTYKYKGEDATRMGLMAQDVEKHHPEAVGKSQGYKTVDYDKATANSEGGAVTPERSGLGFAAGGSAGFDQDMIRELLKSQQQQYGMYGAPGTPLGAQGAPGAAGRVPQASLPVGRLATPAAPPPQQASGMSQAAQTGKNISELYKSGKEAYGDYKKWREEQEKTKQAAGAAKSVEAQPKTGTPTPPVKEVKVEGAPRADLGMEAAPTQMAEGLGAAAEPATAVADALPKEELLSMFAARGGRIGYEEGGEVDEPISAYKTPGLGIDIPDELQKRELAKPAQAPSSGGSGFGIGDAVKIAGTVASLFSDRRMKENIVPIGKTYDGQTVYKYNYKGEPEAQIGLIAQEVEKRRPGAVHEIDGMKVVDYARAVRNKKAFGGSEGMDPTLPSDMSTPLSEEEKSRTVFPTAMPERTTEDRLVVPEAGTAQMFSDTKPPATGRDVIGESVSNFLRSTPPARLMGIKPVDYSARNAANEPVSGPIVTSHIPAPPGDLPSPNAVPVSGTMPTPAPAAGLAPAATAEPAPAPAAGLAPAMAPAPAAAGDITSGSRYDTGVAGAPTPVGGLAPAPAAPAAPAQPGASNFAYSLNRTFQFEGGLNRADTNGQPSLYGINRQYHPEFFENPTKENAAKIYYDQYWLGIGADKMDPKLAHVAFDTAVIAGVDRTRRLLEQAGGDPYKLLELRKQFTDSLIARDPEKYGKYGRAWDNRVKTLAADISGEGGMPTQFAGIGAGGAGLPQPGERAGLTAITPEQKRERDRPIESLVQKAGLNVPEALKSERVIVPLLGGLGAMLASEKRNLGQALGEGLVGGVSAYTDMYSRVPAVEQTQATTAGIEAATGRAQFFKDPYGNGLFSFYRNGVQQFMPLDQYYEALRRGEAPPPTKEAEEQMRAAGITVPSGPAAPAAPAAGGLGAATAPVGAPPAQYAPSQAVVEDTLGVARTLANTPPDEMQRNNVNVFVPQTERANIARGTRNATLAIGQTLAALPRGSDVYASGPSQRYLEPLVSHINSLSRTAFGTNILSNAGTLANIEAVKKEVAQRQNQITSESGQQSYAALVQALDGIPTNLNSPEGQAKLVSRFMTLPLQEIDRDNYYQSAKRVLDANGYQRVSSYAGNRLSNAFDNDPRFERQRYEEAQRAIEKMYLTPMYERGPDGKPTPIMNPKTGNPLTQFEAVSVYGGRLTSDQKAAIEKQYGTGILRFFGM